MPTCKTNLVEWLSAAYTEINESSQSVVVKAWEDTKLSMVWDRTVQGEALAKQHTLFKRINCTNWVNGGGGVMADVVGVGPAPPAAEDVEDPANEVDPEGGVEGAGFADPVEGEEDECPEWFDPVTALVDAADAF